ncbi:hypothetical protein F4805DRAFT_454703 [Annulohypoxylon moriforme]|nr:hypothetical protein F4805DRAFT_454703 [Annulohypoxylon moriforme]
MDPQRRSHPPASPVRGQSWWRAKILLQCASLACCTILLGLSGARTWEQGNGIGILTIPIAAVTAAWTLAELTVLFARRKSAPGRGIHPGAHVGAQLVIFLALILALFYSCVLWRSVQRSVEPCNEWERDPRDPDWAVRTDEDSWTDDGGRRITTSSFFCPESYKELINDPSYRSEVQTLIAFSVMAIHFTLFVRACVETQRRNSGGSVVMVYPQQLPAWPGPYGERVSQSGYRGGPEAAPTKERHYSSEARLYTFSQETKDHLRKFRLTTSRASGPQAVIYYIDKKTHEIKQDEDKLVYKSLEEIADELPDNSPRYILLSYPLTLPSGRMSVPYVLLYYLPNTCNAESRMMYAGAKELMRNTAEVGKVLDIENSEDLDDIPGKLSAE